MKITKEQAKAIFATFQRNPDGAKSYLEFRRRFKRYYGGYVGAGWLGMFLGIEPDGYTHT